MGSSYHELAMIMGTYPKLAIFRRFLSANARNLLVMQAEILNLSHLLGYTITQDKNHDQRKDLEKNIHNLQTFREENAEARQWSLIKQLRALLKEYNDGLLQFEALCRLPPAKKTNVAALRDWLVDPEAGGNFLTSTESRLWQFEEDLTSLAEDDQNKDIISKWIDGPLVAWYHKTIGYRFKKDATLPLREPTWRDCPTNARLNHYPESRNLVTIISTVFASTLPTLAIFALYYVTSPILRLGMITLFTSLFSLILAVFTNAKRSDCFAATAAFVAVLVVFVGSTGGPETANCVCGTK